MSKPFKPSIEFNEMLENLVRTIDELSLILNPLEEHTILDKYDDDYLRLKNWAQVNIKFLNFDIIGHLNIEVMKCSQNDGLIDVDDFKYNLEYLNGIDIVGYIAQETGIEPHFDTSFEYFKYCEDLVEKARRKISKYDVGNYKGYIYALTNKSMPGLIKIGVTHRNPDSRVAELSNNTGVPTPFVLSFSQWVQNCTLIEGLVHKKLKSYRVSENREFFRVDLSKVKSAVDKSVWKLADSNQRDKKG